MSDGRPAEETDFPAKLSAMAALAQRTLGAPLDSVTLRALVQIQSQLQDEQQSLAFEIESGVVSPEAYLGRLSEILNEAMARTHSLVGRSSFQAMFGEAGLHPDGVIDHEPFMAAQSPG